MATSFPLYIEFPYYSRYSNDCSKNKSKNTCLGVGEDVGKKEPSYTVGGNVN
jgi:hypothetical protein